MKREWNIVHDCDLEDGTPTEWSFKVADGKFYWIAEVSDGTFDVIDRDAQTVIMEGCKTLASAKKWVTMNLLQVTKDINRVFYRVLEGDNNMIDTKNFKFIYECGADDKDKRTIEKIEGVYVPEDSGYKDSCN